MKITKTFFTVFFLLFTLASHGQTRLDSINAMIEDMLTSHRLITVLTGIESIQPPIGIARTSNNINYAVAISQVRLTNDDTYVSDIFLRVQIGGQPPGRDVIFFGASGVPLTQAGGLHGDISLALLAPFTFDLGRDISITLLGALGYDGSVGFSPTKATVNCDGFKELTLSAKLTFSDRILKPADGGSGPVTTHFQTTVADWNDILVFYTHSTKH